MSPVVSTTGLSFFEKKLLLNSFIFLFLKLKFEFMSEKAVIINAKGSSLLKEAIRIVAFEENAKLPRAGSSALIINILENDPRIKKKLEELKKKPIRKK